MILNIKDCKSSAFLGSQWEHGCRLDCSVESAGSVATADRLQWKTTLEMFCMENVYIYITFFLLLTGSLAEEEWKSQSLSCLHFFPYDFGRKGCNFPIFLREMTETQSDPHRSNNQWVSWLAFWPTPNCPFFHKGITTPFPPSRQSAPILHTCAPCQDIKLPWSSSSCLPCCSSALHATSGWLTCCRHCLFLFLPPASPLEKWAWVSLFFVWNFYFFFELRLCVAFWDKPLLFQ